MVWSFSLSLVFKRTIPHLISNLTFLFLGDEMLSFLLLKIHFSAMKFAVLIKSFGGHWCLEHITLVVKVAILLPTSLLRILVICGTADCKVVLCF